LTGSRKLEIHTQHTHTHTHTHTHIGVLLGGGSLQRAGPLDKIYRYTHTLKGRKKKKHRGVRESEEKERGVRGRE
jgi:hypothetical protein